jgi:hypothetical protein
MVSALPATSRPDPYHRWGVVDGPWLWPTRIRILFVLDGRITTDRGPGCFGLGMVLDTLGDDSFAWWVRFEVSVVRRDTGQIRQCKTEVDLAKSLALDFRFTQPGFDLDDYDQVWFFGDYPANNYTAPVDDPDFSPLSDPELKLLAEWMDRGGGVFAAGDHFNLGASMCSRIPRVRTMRKWTVEQGVPPMDGPFRHQTLQANPGSSEDPEGDSIPQPIEPVYQRSATSVLARPLIPHPLLCAPSGVIDKFPDHMHEGQVIDDDAVELDLPLDIADYDGVEYPFEALPTMEAPSAIAPELRPRPRPHVIAYGRTTQTEGPEAPPGPVEEAFAFTPSTASAPTGWRFGLVSAYDGDAARIGRVVVDSTWHHWFSYNLHGFVTENPPMYKLMQAYYRNVGLWLATPSQRRSMLVAATWGVVVADPMAFPLEPRRSLWAVGERALDVIGRTATQCTLFEFVKAFLGPGAGESFRVPNHVGPSEPYSASLPEDLALRAIVGGIATSLLEPASVYHRAGGEGRRLLEPEAIVRSALEGAQHGHSALVEAVHSSATSAASMASRLANASRPLSPEAIPISVKLIGLRVVAERLQLTDPADPALVDGHFTLTVRFSIGGTVAADEVIDEIDVPAFDARGGFVDLSRVLYEGVIQSGERGVLEVLSGRADGAAKGDDNQVRFSETLAGEPSSWIGIHTPSAGQSWRLWYRVEHADPGQQTD